MSKPLSSFPEGQRVEVARKRAVAPVDGLGKLSALDLLKQKKIAPVKISKAEEVIVEVDA